ncbi:MAG: RecX family transcriptional regulator [Eubacterium sp.]|nr:RecX family transcriptional regulator [Eubacterium sp.]
MEQEAQIQRAYDQCLKYLSFKGRTEAEMVAYMEKKEYSDRVVAAVMQKLCHYGFVDDEKYLRDYCYNNLNYNFWGRKKMAWDLKKRGIDNPELALEDLFPRDQEKKCCVRQFDKATRQYARESGPKKKSKIYLFLQRKGFGGGLIQEVMAEEMPAQEELSEAEEAARRSADRGQLLRYYEKYKKMQTGKGYQGRELRQRIIRNLMARGYRYGEIEALIREIEEE